MNAPTRTSIASGILAATLLLGACSIGTSTPATTDADNPAASQPADGDAMVDVRLPRMLLDPDGSMSNQQIIDVAAESNITARVEGDIVVYELTAAERDELTMRLRETNQQAIENMIADDSNSVTAVDVNDDMTSFRISVDGAKFSQLESLLVIGFYLQGALYQQFAGVPSDDIDVKVDFVDASTGEVLNSGTYRDWQKQVEEAE